MFCLFNCCAQLLGKSYLKDTNNLWKCKASVYNLDTLMDKQRSLPPSDDLFSERVLIIDCWFPISNIDFNTNIDGVNLLNIRNLDEILPWNMLLSEIGKAFRQMQYNIIPYYEYVKGI